MSRYRLKSPSLNKDKKKKPAQPRINEDKKKKSPNKSALPPVDKYKNENKVSQKIYFTTSSLSSEEYNPFEVEYKPSKDYTPEEIGVIGDQPQTDLIFNYCRSPFNFSKSLWKDAPSIS